MSDFNVRSDSVNVEQIMDQIRARIREKRGVDYTEQQIRELAAVKLETFIDPSGVRSDLLEQFRKVRTAHEPPQRPNFAFEDATLFESHRGAVRILRRLLHPILKLFFNPNPLIQALNIQARLNTVNAERDSAHTATEQLLYVVVHNLVVELTRAAIEVKNLKMRVESLASRVEFNERRARALESVVVYRPSGDEPAPRPQQPPQHHHQQPPSTAQPAPMPHQQGSTSPSGFQQQGGPAGEGPGQRSRRRRRRRGRRGGGQAAAIMGAPAGGPPQVSAAPETAEDHDAAQDHQSAAAPATPETQRPPDDEPQ
ncbi:MAG TPA: hypothetical protein VGY57_08870 [Vicinamibacterales bacterium]|jgi:hypothetical protein|nr:hypothetical protein [Vicinamibacterales bacterium]